MPRRLPFLYKKKMENQVSNSLLSRFRNLVSFFVGFLSTKHRIYRVHQAETRRILARILEIKKKRPELSKYLNEMPEFPTNRNDSPIKLADLRKYHNQLLELLEKYELESKNGIGLSDTAS